MTNIDTKFPPVRWIVEDFSSDNKIWELANSAKSKGCEVDIVDYMKFAHSLDFDGYIRRKRIEENECVVFFGSIQMMLWMIRNTRFVPVSWCNVENFNCSYYYSHVGQFLFNKDYEFTTCGEFDRRKDHFYSKYGNNDKIFIRPNAGLKSFSGQIFKKENHDLDWKYFSQCCKTEDILIVSSVKNIPFEWRFVVVDNQIITGSQYHENTEFCLKVGFPQGAFDKCQQVVDVFKKINGFVSSYALDICVDENGEYHLMEINCLNSAGLYNCDKDKIVDAVNKLAIKDWKKYHFSI